jgi:Alpha amylase, catalytic domain
LSARAGRRVTLGDIKAPEIDPIAELGFDLVWLTSVWTIGPSSRRLSRGSTELRDRRSELLPDGSDDDIVGSPYAISAYEPADSVGGAAGLATLRQRLAAAGIGLILDFVPNQVAVDHPWVRRHPGWFVHPDAEQRAADPGGYFEVRSNGRHWIAHGRDPNYPPWTDTAQLEYRHPDVPRAMAQALREVATRCDGVVCSMAMLVLDDVFRTTWGGRSVPPSVAEDASPFGEFWWHASSAVHEVYPHFLLIGEAYWGHEYRLQQLGFNYTYDKPLLDRFLAGDPRAVAGHLRADDTYQRRSVRLLEDRNGPRIAARMAPAHERAAALIEATLPGMLLVRDGQMAGARSDTPVQFRREPEESPDLALNDFYCKLLHATDDEAFRLGHAIRLEPLAAWDGNATHEGIVARLWVGQHRQLRLAVVNLSGEPAQAFIPLALPEFNGKTVRLDDQLEDITYVRPGDDLLVRGLYVDLPAYGGHLFRITRESAQRRRPTQR